MTDGTTVKTFWTTSLVTSTKYPATSGDGAYALPLRVYRVSVDPTTAVALTKGLLRCDFKVFPWVGPAQCSDPGDTNRAGVAASNTASMTGLGTAALSTSAFVPFVVAYNPGNTWITPLYVDVDEVNGTATATSVTVSSNPATAASGTPANSITIAHQALSNANVTVAAANGQPAITRSTDGAHIRIRAANAGTGCTGVATGLGSVSVGSGVQQLATWLVIEGDPAGAAKAQVLRSPAVGSGNLRAARVRTYNLSIEAQTTVVVGTPATYIWADAFEVRGVAGQEGTTGNPFGATGGLQWYTSGKWWKHGSAIVPSGSAINPVLVRGVKVERGFCAPVLLVNAHLPTSITGGLAGASVTAPWTDVGASLERICLGNDLRWSINSALLVNQSALANAVAPANLTLGLTLPVVSRFAMLNNIAEVYGSGGGALWGTIGENNAVVSTEWVIEGNTFTGDRTNNPYSDLNMATVALNDTTDNLIRVHRFANNVTLKNASKHDFFNDPAVQAQRTGVALSATRNKAYSVGAEIVVAGSPANIYRCTTAGTTATTGGPTGTGSAITDGGVTWSWIATENRMHGFRPNAIGAWASHYGVGYEGNVDLQAVSTADPEFAFEFYGLGGSQLAYDGVSITATPFTLDKSGTSNRMPYQPLPDGTGGGNYRPLASGSGVYALARARSANVDIDQTGTARTIPFAAGGLEAGVVGVLPAAARSLSRAGSGAVGWSATLAGAAAAMPSRAASGTVRWFGGLAPASGVVATRAAPGFAVWSTLIAVQAAHDATRAGATAVTWTTSLAVAGTRSSSSAAAGAAAWVAGLAPDAARSATVAAGGLAAWTADVAVAATRSATTAADGAVAWLAALLPAGARSATLATAGALTFAGSWTIRGDSGRSAIVDRTRPILLPGSPSPPERTLIVTGDLRMITVDGVPTCF